MTVALSFPTLVRSSVDACKHSSWYPVFRTHSPKTTVISPLSKEFIDYLESDGIFAPRGSGYEQEAEGESSGSDEEDGDMHRQFAFPELDAQIRKVIQQYEGAVFPKLNWSSPQVGL